MIGRFFVDALFPPRCLACNAAVPRGDAACDACLGSVALRQSFICPVCRGRLPVPKKFCHPQAPYILGSACDYDDPVVKSLIHGLKFEHIADAARPLADLLIRYAVEAGVPRRGIVVPVPLSPRRLRERGYNQAALIATLFAERFSLSVTTEFLSRSRNTAPQTNLSGTGRTENVRGCFRTAPSSTPPCSAALLIDDVATSGSTLNEAAAALRRGGLSRIIALTVALA